MSYHKFKWSEAILYEDDHYLIINKPPFISSLSDRQDETNMLMLGRKHTNPDLKLAHRLDKETSGALVFCKDPESYRHLSIQFEKRKVEKVYHAVLDGVHDFKDQKVDLAIHDPKKGVMRVDLKKGKPSVTYFTTLKAYSKHTLMECRPQTGRTHQIRVHLSALNAPISGDEKYHGKLFYLSDIKKRFNLKKNSEEEPLVKRMALHAYQIAFTDFNGNKVEAIAPYPKDFEVMIRQLDKNSS